MYNELLAAGKKLTVYNVGREYAGMHGLGIREDLRLFAEHPNSTNAVAFTA